VLRKISGGGNIAGTVAACETTRHHHWRHVGSRAAADESKKTGGSGTSSSSLSPYTSGDLQNTQKHNKQLILVFSFLFTDLFVFLLDMLFSWFWSAVLLFFTGGRFAVEDPMLWVRRRHCCDGKYTPLQGWWEEMKKTVGAAAEGRFAPMKEALSRLC